MGFKSGDSVVINVSGGGGGGNTTWDTLPGKPETYPPTEHSHDGRYYTKSQIDAPEFMSSRIDQVTIELAGNELRAKSVDGLLIGVVDLNNWLSGTSGNIQNQINSINDTITALTAGMRYLGKLETHAALLSVTAMDNGDLAVVLADETRSGARSMYVYNGDLGTWEFIGAFTFSDAFTELTDTPSSYVGADGKVLKADETNGQLVFADVTWGDVQNKPSSTIAQIDTAVQQSHAHPNKSALDRLGVDAQGRVTIDDVPYVPATGAKEYLYARRSGSNQTLNVGSTAVFNTKTSGNIPYDTATGRFTLTQGKVYRVTFNSLINMDNWSRFQMVDSATGAQPTEAPNSVIFHPVSGNSFSESPNGSLEVIVPCQTTRDFEIRCTGMQTGISQVEIRSGFCGLIVQEI